MFFVLFTVATGFLCLWFYLRWRKVKRYWADRGVPFAPPNPFMGNLTFLQKENPHVQNDGLYVIEVYREPIIEDFTAADVTRDDPFLFKEGERIKNIITIAFWLRQIYDEYKHPYVGVWLFWRPALIVNSPEIARRVLVKDFDNFRNRLISSGKTDRVGALALLMIKDPIWTSLRRRLSRVFTSAKMRNHGVITQVKAQDLVQRIKDETAKNNTLDLRTVLTDYTTDVIGESAFGISSESAKNGDSVMRRITKMFMTFNVQRGLSWCSIFFFPELVDIFRFSFFPKDATEQLRQIFRMIIKQRGGYNREIKDPRDLLDVLVKIKQDAADESEEMSEDFLLAQSSNFLLGGFDTSAATMSWVIYELAWHPQYQQTLYEEILQAKESYGGEDLDSAALSKLTYLNCVIKETLRIFPPMGWLDRIAANDYKIDENLTIPAGTTVYVNNLGMQLDPKYFPDPLVFNPDRFLPENEKNITPYTYMPFGEGPRACIGTRFAYQTLRQGLSSIILNFEIQALPNTPEPNEVRVERQGLFYLPLDERMVVQFVPREAV